MGWLSRLSANLLEPPTLTILGVLPHFTAPIFLTHRTLHRFHTNTLKSLGQSMKVIFEEKSKWARNKLFVLYCEIIPKIILYQHFWAAPPPLRLINRGARSDPRFRHWRSLWSLIKRWVQGDATGGRGPQREKEEDIFKFCRRQLLEMFWSCWFGMTLPIKVRYGSQHDKD